jgi:hypothetical protein
MSQYDFLWDYFVWYNVVMIFPENTSYLCQCKTCYSLITVATFTIQLCYHQIAKNWQKVGLNNQSTIASILCCWNITFRWWHGIELESFNINSCINPILKVTSLILFVVLFSYGCLAILQYYFWNPPLYVKQCNWLRIM